MGRRGLRCGPYRVGEDDDGEAGVVTARSRALDARLARLAGDSRVRAAALIASSFAMDPIVVLEERDELKRHVRLAAHNLLQNEAEKAHKRQQRGGASG